LSFERPVLVCILLLGGPARAQSPAEFERPPLNYQEAQAYVRQHYTRETTSTAGSTAIESAEYFSGKGRGYLLLWFVGGKHPYLYGGVTRELWDDFCRASSKGKFYHQRIKGQTQLLWYGVSTRADVEALYGAPSACDAPQNGLTLCTWRFASGRTMRLRFAGLSYLSP